MSRFGDDCSLNRFDRQLPFLDYEWRLATLGIAAIIVVEGKL
jgi:hypothetical protein